MKISVKILQGDSCSLDVVESATIHQVKQQIEDIMKIPVSQQTLVCIGKTLADDKQLDFYPTIKDGAKINLIVKRPEKLNVALVKFLQKYYSEAHSKKISELFMKTFEQKMKTLNLDDLERMSLSYANEDQAKVHMETSNPT